MYLSKHLASLVLASCYFSSAAATSIRARQSAETNITLYAYGTDIGGIPIFYGDGLAYIGSVAPSSLSVVTNITFSATTSSTTTPWTIVGTDTAFSATPSLYIDPTSSFSQVGFTASSSNSTTSIPSGAVTTGFTLFGTNLAYVPESDLELRFWAQATDDVGVWALMWNEAGEIVNGSVPVTVKTTAPLVLD